MEKKLKATLKDGKFVDVTEKRSRTMSKIRGRGNRTTEIKMRFALVGAGVSGWMMHPPSVPGCPDVFFPDRKLAVFLDGCFWHGCPTCGHIPNRINQRDAHSRHSMPCMAVSLRDFLLPSVSALHFHKQILSAASVMIGIQIAAVLWWTFRTVMIMAAQVLVARKEVTVQVPTAVRRINRK